MPEILELIRGQALAVGLDPLLVQALCTHESRLNPWAYRFEPAWQYFWFPGPRASRRGITEASERTLQASSFGLGQIMGAVALELGFDGDLPELFDPTTNLTWMCKKLVKLHQNYSEEGDIISAYNQGSPRKTSGGMYLNQKTYVDPVYTILRELRAAATATAV